MKFLLTLQLLLLSSVLLLAQNKEAAQAAEKDDFKNPEANHHLIEIYEKNPQSWQDDSLLPVAICYALKGDFPVAETLYRKFLVTTPDSTRAIRGLGNCLVIQKKYDEGIDQFRKAWDLGDVQSLGQMALIYGMGKNWDGMERLVPDLLANRQKDLQIVNSLIAFAMLKEPQNKTLFYQAIDGIPDEILLKRADTRNAIFEALKIFGDDKRLKELQAKVPATP